MHTRLFCVMFESKCPFNTSLSLCKKNLLLKNLSKGGKHEGLYIFNMYSQFLSNEIKVCVHIKPFDNGSSEIK